MRYDHEQFWLKGVSTAPDTAPASSSGEGDPALPDAPSAATSDRVRIARENKESLNLVIAEIPRLRRHARFLLRDPELADDLVQECLMRAVAKIESWQAGTNMRAWLLVILHNECVSHWRRMKRIPETVEMLPSHPALAIPGNQDRHLGMIELQRAFRLLSADHQRILLMVAVDGLRYEDAAEVLELPVGTVRSRLFRARTTLRELLDSEAPFPMKSPHAPEQFLRTGT